MGESSDRGRWSEALSFLGLAMLTVLAFHPCLRNGFVSWDDPLNITGAALLRKPDALWRIWFSLEMPSYLPVTGTLWWAQARLFGTDDAGAWKFHAVSLLLHLLNAWLIYRLFSSWVGRGTAWAISALATVHPWHVENVAWATEQKTLLAGIGVWTAWLMHLRAAGPGAGWRWELGSFLAYCFSLLAKPQAVGLPILMLWADRCRSDRPAGARAVVRFLPHAAVAGSLAWLHSTHERARVLADSLVDPSAVRGSVLQAAGSFVHYLGAFLLPDAHTLGGVPAATAAGVALGGASLVAVVAALVLAVRHGRRNPPASLGVLGYLVLLAPVSGLVWMPFLLFAGRADRYMYMPLPFALLLAHALAMRLGECVSRRGHHRPAVWTLVAGSLLVFWTTLSYHWCFTWRSGETLWMWMLPTTRGLGRYVAHHNLGTDLLEQRDHARAIRHFRWALEVVPTARETASNLAWATFLSGEKVEAAASLRRLLATHPRSATIRNQLGVVLASSGKAAEAEREFLQALEADPECEGARENLERLRSQPSRDPSVPPDR